MGVLFIGASSVQGVLIRLGIYMIVCSTHSKDRTKSGYLWYAETKTFGTHWTRLHFCIKKGMLVSAEVRVHTYSERGRSEGGEEEGAEGRREGGGEKRGKSEALFLAFLSPLQSTAKVKVPISLNLNLCSVKLAQVTDSERNFCFKVVSPIRTLLLQAESTLGELEIYHSLYNTCTCTCV